jgi:hypothetical protein
MKGLTTIVKAAIFLLAQPQTFIDPRNRQLAIALGWAASLGDGRV